MNQWILIGAFLAIIGPFSCGAGETGTTDGDATDANETETAQDPIAAALVFLNQRRAESGLSAVSGDADLATGCEEHVLYMHATGKVIHRQDPNNPHFTTTGAKAGENATLTGNVASLTDAIHAWLAEPYHRRPLLHPGLTVVGGAYSDGYACLDVFSSAQAVKDHAPIPYPGRDAMNIPTTYDALGAATPLPGEWSPPAGTVISYELPAHWALHETTDVSLRPVGTEEGVSLWLRLPNDPTDPYATFQGNTILAIPETPLNANTTYECSVEGQTVQQADGAPGPLVDSWTFTTAD